MDFHGYKIFVSDRYPHKYYALVGKRKIYFGDVRYQQYFDQLGHYSSLNHMDQHRRFLYLSRHKKDKDKVGSAGWFAANVLW